MKKLIVLLVVLFVTTSLGYSQLKEKDNLLGFSVGLNTGPSSPTIGVNFENQITTLGDVATLGLGAILRYTSWKDNNYHKDYYDYSFVTIGAQLNVNFNQIGTGKFVPFIGAVLGYNNVNSKYVNNNGVVYDATYSSGMWLWGQAGFRYFFSPSFAGGLRAGTGNYNFNSIELALDFKL